MYTWLYYTWIALPLNPLETGSLCAPFFHDVVVS